MDQKIAGLVGAIAGLASLDAAQGAATAAPDPEQLSGAGSFAELLSPIPNALAMLRAQDATVRSIPNPDRADANSDVKLAQNHHHHHHHRYIKPKRRHHHHHHHHHND